MNVQFCNSNAFRIDSEEFKEKVMVECDSLLGFKLKRGHFPGPQPVAIEKKDFDLFKNEEYMICEKSDGERAILLLINLNNKPMCFIINRNNEFYFMDLSFKKEVFEGTIMDGELIKTKKENTWNYLIHDCMVYNGTNFIEKNHRLRYSCIIDFIVKRYQNKKTDPVNIKTKLFYRMGPGIEKTWKCISDNTENNIDGLIFTPVNKPFKFGRDYSLLKWKQDHTIDFLVEFKGKSVSLKYYKEKEIVVLKKYSSLDENYKKIMEFIKENDIKIDCPIIEFKVIDNDSFIPYRIRLDKKIPNSEITVQNTFKNVQENICLKDIANSFLTSATDAPAPTSGPTSTCTGGCGPTASTTDISGPTASATDTTGPAASTCTSSCGPSASTTDSCGPSASTAESGRPLAVSASTTKRTSGRKC